MKMCSIKALTFWFSFLAMTNTAGILTGLTNEIETSKHQKRHHSNSHRRPSHCEIPIPNTTFTQLSLRISTNLHTQNRGLDILVSAEAFAPHPIPTIIDPTTNPNTIIVTDPHVAQLIRAVDSTTQFGRTDLLQILKAFEINGEALTNSLFAFLFAGEQYSIAVANGIPSAPYLQAWSAAGTEVANQLALVLDLKPNSRKFRKLQELSQEVVNDETHGILGLNELLPQSDLLPGETQSDAALRFFIMGRAATTSIGKIAADQLVINFNGDRCKVCEKP